MSNGVGQSGASVASHDANWARWFLLAAVVVTGAGGNFCSGGDVFEIIED